MHKRIKSATLTGPAITFLPDLFMRRSHNCLVLVMHSYCKLKNGNHLLFNAVDVIYICSTISKLAMQVTMPQTENRQ